ncbi:TetR family transcriptional regulator [Achromobacter xylosoxidans]|uniref:TetR/AcrR family transcriptional regulator n=1 Tax=Achromobacter aegrifaciens TaxID=1287736 RepID=UPI000D4F8985|nr:TetR/AcrR family transcriptional regulator C-terminal domain-containing protein [Achromobacter aegrifaciens]MDQ1760268.1 TetR/AcrR family transcriptional regulator C-terminal domain-containing protein [Achromobacter aegrifaciens]PTN52153.1 TetR family transcriptional regulator [Achromobacter xylosoxidans]
MPTAKKPATDAAPRKRGRPPRVESPINGEATLSRAAIIERAIALARETSLDQISMVQLARDFGVAPGLIHYYLGGRDKLISGVLNNYYRERLARMPALTGDWRADIETIARVSLAFAVENPGVSTYVASHNRFRLFQDVDSGETDFGAVFFNHVTTAFMQGGFSAEQVALAYHLLAQFLVASSRAEASKQLPVYHRDFIRGRLDAMPADRYPGARYVAEAFSGLSTELAFEAGLRILLDGIAQWAQEPGVQAKPKRKTATR